MPVARTRKSSPTRLLACAVTLALAGQAALATPSWAKDALDLSVADLTAAAAASAGAFTVSGPAATDDLEISRDLVLTGTGALGRVIKVVGGTAADPVTITLQRVSLAAGDDQQAALQLAAGANARIRLVGDSVLAGSSSFPGLGIPVDAAAELTADALSGTLDAKATGNAAAIGGNGLAELREPALKPISITGLEGASCGALTISGGTITADTSEAAAATGAAIGGGRFGAGCDVTISGGVVTAIGAAAAGIGGGIGKDGANGYSKDSPGGDGGEVTISGGTVTATSMGGPVTGETNVRHSAAIGGGRGGGGGAETQGTNGAPGKLTITGGSVKLSPRSSDMGAKPKSGSDALAQVKVPDVADVTKVVVTPAGGTATELNIPAQHSDGALYLFLPFPKTYTIAVTSPAGTTSYRAILAQSGADVTAAVPTPGPSLSAEPVKFTDLRWPYVAPSAKVIHLTNVGDSDATVSGVTITPAGAFTLTKPASLVVPAGGTDSSISVRPNSELSVGVHEASVLVTYASGETLTIPVSFAVTGTEKALTFEERAAALVAKMTVAEKIRQLDDKAPAIERLGLKSYDYWNEALHGVMASGTTMFPSATAIASTWDRGLVSKLGDVIGDEARVLNNETGKGLSYWSPTLNIYRDPRWGRADESYSEDPYLVGQIGERFIKGMQGDDPNYLKTVSTPKHFFANNSESNRRNGNSEVTERELREYYTPAFAHALSPEVGAYSFMTAYNRVNGVPMSASTEYLEDLAKRTWGFQGYITTDCSAVADIWNRHKWKPEGWDRSVTAAEASAWSLKAGSDIDCQGNTYEENLQTAYDAGLISDADLDSELTALLTGRFKLGEFDTASKVPYRSSDYSRAAKMATPEHQAAALQVSQEAPVLLKNAYIPGSGQRGLPLDKGVDKIAVVGYLGNLFTAGGYSGSNPVDQRTFRQGVEQVAKEINPNATVEYIGAGITPGVTSTETCYGTWCFTSTTASGKPGVQNVTFKDSGTVVKTIKAADVQDGYPLSISDDPAPDQFIKWEGWMGINWGYNDYMRASSVWGGYFTIRADLSSDVDSVCITQSGNTAAVPKAGVFDVHLDSMTGPKVATVPAEGAASSCGTVDDSALAPEATGGIHDLYFVYNPGTLGKYGEAGTEGHPWAYDLSPEQEAKIAEADAVIVMTGTTNTEAAEEMDRVNIDMPRFQDEMVAKVAALNKRTIAWVQSVGQMDIEKFRTLANVPSIVWTNYNGQSQGIAAGEILFGEVNPSGRLPFTWYSDIDQVGSVWDYSITPGDTGASDRGRTYQYFTGDVSYNFGYGLSYSKFSYSNLRLDASSYTGDDTITAKVDVTNTSKIPGKEVVQLYVTAPGADGIKRPKRQLKGFEKVTVGAMDTKTVTIKVPVEDLWFWDDANDKAIWDKGTWRLQVGPQVNSGPSTTFKLTADPTPYLDVVAAVNDGTVLNIAAPDTVIHSNLSASRNDQTFLDLDSRNVKVEFSSSDPAVAAVDSEGVVYAKGEGIATITATVTALGSSKSDSYAVVVKGSDAPAPVINMADQKVELPDAGAVSMNAELALVPAGAKSTSMTYLIAPMDENTAGASITSNGVLTATKAGKVRVTAVGSIDGAKVSAAAEVTVVPEGALAADNTALTAAIAAAQALAKSATPASAESSGLLAAIETAKAALGATDQKTLDNAVATLTDAVSAAESKLVMVDTPSARAALIKVLKTAIERAEAIDPARLDPAAYQVMLTAVTQAKQVVADPESTVEQIQAATLAVLDALSSAPAAGGAVRLDGVGATVTIADRVYTGKRFTSGFTVALNGVRLYEGVDYATSTLGSNVSVGRGSVTIVGKGDYAGTRVVEFKILPKKTSVTKAKAGKGSVKVSYKKVSSAQKVSKYEVRYRVKGSSSWKTVSVSPSKSSVTIKKLKKGKVYQVQVRAYKTVSGVKYYAAWSGSKYSSKVK